MLVAELKTVGLLLLLLQELQELFFILGGGGVPTTTRVKMVRVLQYHQVLLELTKSFPLDAAPHVPIFVFRWTASLHVVGVFQGCGMSAA